MNRHSIVPTFALLFACALVLTSGAFSQAADPWADEVVSYVEGTGVATEWGSSLPYNDSSAALGEPTRFSHTAFGDYPTTPFQTAAGLSEVVSLGEGGELVVRFDEPVVDDPLNPFGIDLLVFGNSFFGLNSYNNDPNDTADGSSDAEGGVIWLSDDGVNYLEVTGVGADGVFPTLGYSDVTIPWPTTASVPTDFTLPVDPSTDVTGMNTSQVIAAYAGSGGGAGIDLASVGLAQVTHVKITNPVGSGITPEIDGLADVRAVPEPAGLLLAAVAFGLAAIARRR